MEAYHVADTGRPPHRKGGAVMNKRAARILILFLFCCISRCVHTPDEPRDDGECDRSGRSESSGAAHEDRGHDSERMYGYCQDERRNDKRKPDTAADGPFLRWKLMRKDRN